MNTPTHSEELPAFLARFRAILDVPRRYHDYRVEGLEHIPREGGFLLVCHHSFATYDGFMLGVEVHEATGRVPTALGDDLIFKTPIIAEWAHRAGVRPANPANGEALLRDGHMVFVAPGGMREALRPSTEKYQVRWDKRRGFVRLALKAGVPIVCAGCPAADDIFTLYENRLTKLIYKRLKLPAALFRGVGFTPWPRKVQLTHFISPPLVPPPYDPEREEAQVEALHADAVAVMTRMLQR